MANAPSILIVSGTHRPGSNALKVARLIEGAYTRAGMAATILSLTELPPEAFSGEAYAVKPPAVVAIQARVLAAGGLHIVTPEYNGSFPGVLKHFIDLLKFPESFERKPVAFVGESAGQWGALRAVEQLQAIFCYRNAHMFPERVFIPGVHAKFDDTGQFTDAALLERLTKQAEGFARFVSVVTP